MKRRKKKNGEEEKAKKKGWKERGRENTNLQCVNIAAV